MPKVLILGLLLLATLTLISLQFQLRFNTTASMPIGIYRAIQKPLVVNDWVAVCLPKPLAQFALSRSYVMGGQCDGGAEPVLKQVVGTAGDDINLQTDGVIINGKMLPHSETLTHDSAGRVLPAIACGHRKLNNNELWLYGNHNRKSWDSRYFGAITVAHVVAVLQPVIMFS